MSRDVDEFFYKLPGLHGGWRPGAHAGRSQGSGQAFAGHVRLLDQPDPRRLDLRASLRNPRREWLVRATRQRAAVQLMAVVDVSASMHFGMPAPKLGIAADFLAALGHSAFRSGDAVGLAAFDHEPREELSLPPRSGRGIGLLMAERLRRCEPRRAGAGGSEGLAGCLDAARRAGLVFLVSDFHWPLDGLPGWLEALAPARVVPIVVWSQAEVEPPTDHPLLALQDAETGRRRSYWLRPRLREAWREGVARRRAELESLFRDHGTPPCFMQDRFDAERLSRFFMEELA